MYGRTDSPQQWSVHAEFTISHPGADDPTNLPQTNTIQDENGVRMSYTWMCNEPTKFPGNVPSSGPANSYSACSDGGRTGYQRGNLFFTTTPPGKFSEVNPNVSRLGVQDSGYGSDLYSSSLASNTLPRPSTSNNRKCRSTCSIILSSNIQDDASQRGLGGCSNIQCGRTQSLRCQTSAPRYRNKDYHFYGCGDPWCYHSQFGDELSSLGRISPVTEICEDTQNKIFATRIPSSINSSTTTVQKKDASVQTFEMIDRCTSPAVKADSFIKKAETPTKNVQRIKRQKPKEILTGNRVPINRPSSKPPNSFRSPQPLKLDQPSDRKDLPGTGESQTANSTSDLNDSLKKPRTVHIDVYCTGTDIESSDSTSDSSQIKTDFSPQTVFESKNLCISHKRADTDNLPFHLINKLNNAPSNTTTSQKTISDLDDLASTAYPSNISSYSTINDFLSSMSSVRNSRLMTDDSIANTSWKDTYSDISNIGPSSSSSIQMNPSGSYGSGFIPKVVGGKKMYPNIRPTQDEMTPGVPYNMNRDQEWKKRRFLLQQRKIRDFIQKSQPQDKSKDSDSDVSDSSEIGWTFIRTSDNKLERSATFRKRIEEEPKHLQEEMDKKEVAKSEAVLQDTVGIPSSSSVKSPTPVSAQEKSYSNTMLRSPFAILPGQYSEQRYVASRFGPIINMFKKPGHHVGPSKNQDCLCVHCQSYFQNLRNKT